jgi:phosphate acetyltransferase
MSVFDHIYQQARSASRTIVLPEGDDPRMVEAAAAILLERIANPILIGNPATIQATARKREIKIDASSIIDPATANNDSYIDALVELRQHKGMTRDAAAAQVMEPLMYGTLMVQLGDADGFVAGAANTTSAVLRAALKVIGMAPGSKLVSSFFIMEHDMPHQAIQGTAIYADCAMVIDPDAEQLADIAITTADSASGLLGMEPKIALLSFSTAGSAKHPHVDKVRHAGEIVRDLRPDLQVMPEVQFDAAIIPEILGSKAPDLRVSAPANVFIFPELQSANIGYKIAQRIGGVTAVGPILQGLRKPVNDLSRGCSVDDIVQLVAVTAAQAAQQPG